MARQFLKVSVFSITAFLFYSIRMVETNFFELIQVGLSNRESLSEAPDRQQWKGIFELAKRHAIIGVLFPAIERLPESQRPPSDIVIGWYAISERIKGMNLRLDKQIVWLSGRLRRLGMPSCILKGQGVAQYYPSPLLRSSGDMDIWLGGGRKAIMGFFKAQGLKTGDVVYHHVDVCIFKDTEVEAHFRPSWLWNPVRNARLQRWFKLESAVQMRNEMPLPDAGGSIVCPTRDFNAVFLLVHIYRHLFDEGIGLRQLMDYYYCVVRGGDNAAVARNLRRFGLLRFASAVMYVLKVVFGLDEEKFLVRPDEKLGRQLLTEIMLAGNFGKYDIRLTHDYVVGSLGNLRRKHRRNMKFYLNYPGELFWEIPFKVWHYCWRASVNRWK